MEGPVFYDGGKKFGSQLIWGAPFLIVAPLRCAPAYGSDEWLVGQLTQPLSLSSLCSPRERTGLTYAAPAALEHREFNICVASVNISRNREGPALYYTCCRQHPRDQPRNAWAVRRATYNL